MRAIALSLTHAVIPSADLVRDTVAKAWSHLDRRLGTRLSAWLSAILHDAFYPFRRLGREVACGDAGLVGTLAEKPAHDGRVRVADVLRAFRHFPDEQHEAPALVGAQGFSCEEAAAARTAAGTVKSRPNRARAGLARLLGLGQGDRPEPDDAPTRAVIATSAGPHP